MRKNSIWVALIAIFMVTAVTSCKKKHEMTVEEKVAEMLKPRYDVTQADTTEVLAQVQHYLQLLKDNQISDALAMLYFYQNDSIVPLPKRLAARQMTIYNTFKGVRYNIEKITFLTPIDNEVVYLTTLFDKAENDPRPNEMRFVLKPVRIDGKWYLTLADSPTSTINLKGTEIK